METRAGFGLNAPMAGASDIAIVIPAAGASSRMRGRDKLLEEVDGLALLRRQALRALDTGAHLAVTVPALDHPRAAALDRLEVQRIIVPDAAEGMAASLRRAAAGLPDGLAAVIVLPGDMPDIETGDLLLLLKGFRDAAEPTLQQATAADGRPGHPVLFPADCLPEFADLKGDQGARSILRANAHRLQRIALQGTRALTDLDTPEAWAAWRAQHPSS